MKTPRIGKTVMMVPAIILLLSVVFAPVQLQAATAQVRACAEVVKPALVDSSRLLAAAGPEQAGKVATGKDRAQAEPEVKLI